jgi:maltose O-acetyltransferase
MITEKQKMLAGEMYNPSDSALIKERHREPMLFHKFNSFSSEYLKERQKILLQILENAYIKLSIELSFYCD